jgi:hypothetical protein
MPKLKQGQYLFKGKYPRYKYCADCRKRIDSTAKYCSKHLNERFGAFKQIGNLYI